ncbi:hypothetical protein DXG01_009016 [Tephrocybe rancida]|nr:hypothetical protein DXG01_009016 [Tephrocybe rancida]
MWHAGPVGRRGTGGLTDETFRFDGWQAAVLGPLLSPAAHTKSAVYRLKSLNKKTNPGYVIKIYAENPPRKEEIDALKLVGQYVASEGNTNSVAMTEAKGITMAQMLQKELAKLEETAGTRTEEQQKEKRNQCAKAFAEKWRIKVAQKAAEIAVTKNILHGDLNWNNIVVDGDKIQLIDWEHYLTKGKDQRFKTDVNAILKDLEMVWDSSITKINASYKSSKSSGAKSSSAKTGSPKFSSKASGSRI